MISRHRTLAALAVLAALGVTIALTSPSVHAASGPAGAGGNAATRPAGCPGPWLGRYTNAAPSISGNGRFVVWEGYPDPESIDVRDVLLRDLRRGTTIALTRAAPGRSYYEPVISDNGDRVVYSTQLAGDPEEGYASTSQIYVYDRRTKRTTLEGLGHLSSRPDITADGRAIVFTSGHGPWPDTADVYVRNIDTDVERLVSRTPAGTGGNGFSRAPTISADGRFVLFSTTATDLTPAAPEGGLLIRDRRSGTTVPVRNADGSVNRTTGLLSPDGRYVAYSDDRIRVHDLERGTTVAASQVPGEAYTIGNLAGISARGRKVAYGVSYQIGGDLGDAFTPVLVRNLRSGADTVASAGTDGELEPWTGSYAGGITPNGRYVVFYSNATNLPGDPDPALDVFVRDLKERTTTLVSTTEAGGACE